MEARENLNLREALATLSDAHRRAVELKFVGRRKLAEVATEMSLTPNHVRRLLREATAHLKAVMP